MDNNQDLRSDEIKALEAIYQNEFAIQDENSCSITIIPEWPDADSVKLEFRLPERYPLEESPSIVVSAPWMDREDKLNLVNELNSIWASEKGNSILYSLIEKAREFVNQLGTKQQVQKVEEIVPECSTKWSRMPDVVIHHGTALVDRRSTFQAHLAPINSTDEIETVLNQLKSNKKIASATHNIWAYRIVKDNGVVCHDCDDDGETAAASRLLHLLDIVDARNVMIVVSRWYGGIQLGPDRFKHINNVARSLLIEHNYVKKC